MRPALPWILALVGSVLINGVLVGYMVHRTADGPSWHLRGPAGAGMSHHRGSRDGRRDGTAGRSGFDLRGFVDALPETARSEARQRLRATFSDMHDLALDGDEARRELDALLTADTFDADAVAAAMARLHEHRRAIELRIEAVVLEVVAGLDAETRTRALQAGRERMGRRGPPRGDGRPGDRRGVPDN